MRDKQKHIGKSIRAIRTVKGETQSAFSLFIGYSQSILCSIELGKTKPTEDFLDRFCSVLNLEKDKLVRFAEKNFKNTIADPLEAHQKTIDFLNNQHKEGPYAH